MDERYISIDGKTYKASEVDKVAEIAAIEAQINVVQQDKANTVASYDAQLAVLQVKLDELRTL